MFGYILLFIVFLIFCCVLYELKYYKFKKTINDGFTGPPSIPILGNVHQFKSDSKGVFDQFFSWWYEYGLNYRFWIASEADLMISDIKDVEFILTSNSMTQKPRGYHVLHPWLGKGLLTSNGAHWHKHRKMITPSFHFKILQEFHEIMNSNSLKFVEKLRKAAEGESIFDFQNMVHYFTLDLICETAMGVNINAMDNKNSKLVKAFEYICMDGSLRPLHPIKSNNTLFKLFPEYAQYKKTLATLQDFTYEIINQRIESKSKETEKEFDEFSRKKTAFLDTLLSANIDGKPLSQQEIYEEVSTFIFAGHDTTSSGISFMIYLLSRHPEIQQKVFEEQQVILEGNLKRDVTYQEIFEMKYLDMVFKETFRLYPSAPIISRLAEKDYQMNGKLIPKNTTLNIFLMALGYNEQLYPNPYQFNPERFSSENLENKQNPFAYVPFSAGPRNCIGQKFAALELKTVVSKIVRSFEILPPLDELISKNGYVQHYFGLSEEERHKIIPNPSKYDPELALEITLKSKNGVHIRLRERK